MLGKKGDGEPSACGSHGDYSKETNLEILMYIWFFA